MNPELDRITACVCCSVNAKILSCLRVTMMCMSTCVLQVQSFSEQPLSYDELLDASFLNSVMLQM